jgi:hypothetical protein
VQPVASVAVCGETCRRIWTVVHESRKLWRHCVMRDFGLARALADSDSVRHWREVHAYLREKQAYATLAGTTSSGFEPLAARCAVRIEVAGHMPRFRPLFAKRQLPCRRVVFADDGLAGSAFPPENALTVGRSCWCTGRSGASPYPWNARCSADARAVCAAHSKRHRSGNVECKAKRLVGSTGSGPPRAPSSTTYCRASALCAGAVASRATWTSSSTSRASLSCTASS